MQRENSGPSRLSIRLGAGLVVAQMTACTLLVISAGLLLSGFRSALLTSAGRRLSAPIVVSLEALQQTAKSQERNNGLGYFDAAARAAREVAGASTVTWVATVPGNRPIWQSFVFESAQVPRRAIDFEQAVFTARTVEAIVLPPLAGRLFGPFDKGACGGVVLSREAARQLGDERAIGRSIELPSGEWAEVIGVVQPKDAPSAARVYHYNWSGDSDREAPAAKAASYRVPELTAVTSTVLDVNIVSPNYFSVMGLPIVTGRDFTAPTDSCRVAVVNQEAADLYFNGDAVGGAIIDSYGRRTSVIGVVGSATLRAAARGVAPAVYFPLEQDFQPRMSMIAETSGVDRTTLRQLHRRIAGIPGGRENRIIVTTLDAHLSRTALAPERIATVLVGASASMALLLGMLGLYGVMNDAARRRRREFALRITLGAQGGHVIGQVLAEGMRLAIAGSIGGIAGSFLVGRWLARITPPGDEQSVLIWIAAPAALSAAVAIASVLPARRALGSDPILIMREP